MANREGFGDMYARAKELQAHALADEIVEISDDARNDWMARNDPDNPGWQANGEHLQRSRLRVDTRKCAASKIMPKVYGDRVQSQQLGRDGEPTDPPSVPTLHLTIARE